VDRIARLKGLAVPLAVLLLLAMVQPGEAGVAVIGGLSREKTVEPGKTYKGVMFICNPGDKPQDVKVYQTDYLFFCDGTNLYGEPGKDPRSNADWISFSPPRLTIPPGQTVPVNYVIQTPADESLKGTYWSMIMVEGVSEVSPPTLESEQDTVKVGIRNVIRYGVQIVTHIGNTGSVQLEFLATKLLRQNGKRLLRVEELYDQDGRYVGRFEGLRVRTFPGTSVRGKIDLTSVPEGTYQALLVADGGADAIFGVTYTLKLEEEQATE